MDPVVEKVQEGTKVSTSVINTPSLLGEVFDRMKETSVQVGVSTCAQIITGKMSLKEAIKQGAINIGVNSLGALGANQISKLYDVGKGPLGYVDHKVAHFTLGSAMGLAMNYEDPLKGLLSGGLASVGTEIIADFLPPSMSLENRLKVIKLTSGIGAFLAGADVNTAVMTSSNAFNNNSASTTIARLTLQTAPRVLSLEAQNALGIVGGGLAIGGIGISVGEYINGLDGNENSFFGSSLLAGFVLGIQDELMGGLPQIHPLIQGSFQPSAMDLAPTLPQMNGGFTPWGSYKPPILVTPLPDVPIWQEGFTSWNEPLRQFILPVPHDLPNMSVLERSTQFTEPTLPPKIVVYENGVKIIHYTKSGDHGPPHLHVKGEGKEVKIGQNGKPIKGEAELTSSQEQVINNNKSKIRNAVQKIQKWHKYKEGKE